MPTMFTRKSGHIVTIASSAGYFGSANLPAYSASKFAVVGLHEALETEFASVDGWSPSMTLVCPYFISGTNMPQRPGPTSLYDEGLQFNLNLFYCVLLD